MTQGAIPTLGYRTKYEAAAALRAKGMQVGQIAEKIGCNVGTVWRLLAYANEKPPMRKGGRRPVPIPLTVLEALKPEAKRRKLSTYELSRRLLRAISRDNLVSAVLDDKEAAD